MSIPVKMNVNKKFDRLKQWGKERMGGEVATNSTDEFKALETEMELRHQGMDRLQQSTSAYIKSLSKRDQGEGKDKLVPIAHFGSTMIAHGDDFEPDSEFGSCLLALGRANERIARMQETYCANATSSWLESVERSQVQMKEYQAARKKLESRRLAYDTASGKMQKSKKEDYRMEEELRSQKAKYEESCEEVWRRMMDVKEAEGDSVADLTSFLEAECAYYERCREVLVQLRKEWPASSTTISRSSTSSPVQANGVANPLARRPTRTRSRASSITDRFSRIAEEEGSVSTLSQAPAPPTTRSPWATRSVSAQNTPGRELPGFDFGMRGGGSTLSRTNTASTLGNGYTIPRDQSQSPAPMPRLTRVPTEPTHLLGARNNLRITKRDASNVFRDNDEVSDLSDSSEPARSSSWSLAANDGGNGSLVSGVSGITGKKPPPPPPPSRATKPPPPPPPPLKRSALSTGEVPRQW